MRKISILAGGLALLFSVGVFAKPPEQLPDNIMYRYHNDDGRMVLTSTLSEEAIYAGYDILDSAGRFIKSVEAAPTPEEQEELKEELAQKQKEARQRMRDRELLRLYGGPEDAVLTRDRKKQAFSLNIAYAENNIKQLQEKLDRELELAAKAEQAGREVSEGNRLAIERFSSQIESLKEEIRENEAKIKSLTEEFDVVIERLKVIEKERQEAEQSEQADAQHASSN